MILLKTRKKNKKLTDSITEKKQVKVFGKEFEKEPLFQKGLSQPSKKRGENKLDVFLRALHFSVVKKAFVTPCLCGYF